ncbi:MAG TPA: ribonuclease R [Vicinamibacteria bacterium]|nr:ribonuclease R [Vicinamibacteria bacterium]
MRDQVVGLLHAERKPVSVRELVKRLRLEGEQRKELKSVLRKLIGDGEVVNVRGARVGLPDRMNLVVGRLSCSPSGYGFVAPERRGQKDVYVSAVNMKEALQGDRVVVRVERVTPKGPEGRIIRVLERALTRMVGRYEEDGKFGGHVVPFDKRLLHELFIPPGQEGGAASGQMVSAEITRPPTATRNPTGRVLEVLGRLEDKGVDLKVVMAKHALPDSFPPDVEEEAARVPRSVRDEDRAGRTDFRPWPTITVDPETARDHDDAISLDHLPNGHWLLGVHIADVAHYVPEGSRLDQEAYLRGTSVYFPDRVVPMLPHALSSGICSLVEHQDRLTQSVVIELDGKGRIVRSELHDGVIRSAARLSYQQAQAIVDGDAEVRGTHASLVGLVERMDELAKLMRKQRSARGALDFDQPEPKLILDAAGEVSGIVAHERLDSMRAIEEFMLAANEAVAEKLSSSGMGALFRIHEQPDPEKVEEFCDLVASLGYRVPTHLDQVRQEDFQRILRQTSGKPEERLVSYLLLRTMKLARYHEENLGHFGLATEMYAHFTSPIRRYPDLVVHRALRALRQGRPSAGSQDRLAEMGRHLSERERIATDAERELTEWKKVRYMADKLGEVYSGYVTGVQAFGLFVELDGVYVQGLVHVSSMSDDYYAFAERAHTLKGENAGRTYRLGDAVRVQVAKVDLEQRKVDFALADLAEPRAGRPRRPLAAPRAAARRSGGRESQRTPVRKTARRPKSGRRR